MNLSYLLLGSNIGNRLKNLSIAEKRINEALGSIKTGSSVYETEPWGFDTNNLFLNKVIAIETELDPHTMLNNISQIENEFGRVRSSGQYQSRTIDIDILFYGNQVISSKTLKIPHPQLHNRRFTLIPLNEIAPDLMHPLFHKPVKMLLEECPDKLTVHPVTEI